MEVWINGMPAFWLTVGIPVIIVLLLFILLALLEIGSSIKKNKKQ